MKDKITQGEWIVRFMENAENIDTDDNMFFVQAPNPKFHYGTEILMEDFGDHSGYTREARLADAQLIALAGNLAQKYDPSTWEQKLSQFDKMEKALQKISKSHNGTAGQIAIDALNQ